MQRTAHRFHVEVFHAHRIPLVRDLSAELMLKIQPPVPDLFVTPRHLLLLFRVISASAHASRKLPLFPGKLFFSLPVIPGISRSRPVRKYRKIRHREIDPEHLFRTYHPGCLVFADGHLVQQARVKFPRRFSCYGHGLQSAFRRDLSVDNDPDASHLGKPETSSVQHDIPVYHVCRVTVRTVMLCLELREADLRISEKVPVGRFEMKLCICKGKRIYFLQPFIFFFVLCGGVPQHLSRLLIFFLLVRKHPVIQETAASECFGHKDFLLRGRIQAEAVCFIRFSISLSHGSSLPVFRYTNE